MINHARTLLLNRPGGSLAFSTLGEQYIPSQFAGQQLEPWMTRLHAALFGAAPDTTYMNYQAERLLRFVHANEYETYLFQLDPRVTYDPFKSDFGEASYKFTYTSSAPFLKALTPVTPLVANEVLGLMSPRWNIQLTDGSVLALNLSTGHSTTVDQAEGATTAIISLPDVDLRVQLDMTSSTPGDWNGMVQTTALLRPQRDLVMLMDQVDSMTDLMGEVFAPPLDETYTTFYNLWRSTTLPERVVGLVLAFVYRLNDLYNQA